MVSAQTDHSFFTKSKFAKANTTTTTTTTVVTRIVHRPKPAPVPPTRGSSVSSLSSISSSEASSSSRPAKRKLPERAPSPARKPKKARRDTSPLTDEGTRPSKPPTRSSKRASREITPEDPPPEEEEKPAVKKASTPFSINYSVNPDVPVPRPCLDPGDAIVGDALCTSHRVVTRLKRSYKHYFRNLQDPDDKSFTVQALPTIDLEYPNNGAVEKFLLLQPNDKDHYNPIYDIQHTVEAMVEMLPPEAQQWYKGNKDESMDALLRPSRSPSPLPTSVSCASSPPHSRGSSSSSLSSLTTISSASSSSTLSSLSSISSTSSSLPALDVDYLRQLQRAINKHNGPLFVDTIQKINRITRALKYPRPPPDPFDEPHPNVFRAAVAQWEGMRHKTMLRVLEETYQRAVGPDIPLLRKYESFSNNVYGELNASFVADIAAVTKLGPGSLFLDLGSGVGNVCLQMSLQTGCRSFGVEIAKAPAEIAQRHLEQFRLRCKMWGVTAGEVELERGDLLKCARVHELIQHADVVLVNNKVFLPELNEQVKMAFLPMKENALVVSLVPFAAASLTQWNMHAPTAYLEYAEREFRPGDVSWAHSDGKYYIQRVNRARLADFYVEHMDPAESGQARRTSGRRR